MLCFINGCHCYDKTKKKKKTIRKNISLHNNKNEKCHHRDVCVRKMVFYLIHADIVYLCAICAWKLLVSRHKNLRIFASLSHLHFTHAVWTNVVRSNDTKTLHSICMMQCSICNSTSHQSHRNFFFLSVSSFFACFIWFWFVVWNETDVMENLYIDVPLKHTYLNLQVRKRNLRRWIFASVWRLWFFLESNDLRSFFFILG